MTLVHPYRTALPNANAMKTETHLDQFVVPRVLERRVLLCVLFEGVLSVQQVDAEMAERGPEEVLLGAVLEQGAVQTGARDLLVDLDGLLVVLELGRVLGHLQHALVGRAGRLFALEVIGRLLVVLNGTLLKKKIPY